VYRCIQQREITACGYQEMIKYLQEKEGHLTPFGSFVAVFIEAVVSISYFWKGLIAILVILISLL
jgi:uncharacterized membrane protein